MTAKFGVMWRMPATLVLAVAVACGGARAGDGDARPRVVASFYPLAFAARQVAGGRADVTNLTPAGAEPHDLELTPGQVRTLAEADLALYVGGGFQPAVEEVAAEVGDRALDVLEGDRPDTAPAPDPHAWLDPTRMAVIVELVADGLAEADPGGARAYRSNARRLSRSLDRLDRRFRRALADCRRDEIVVSHAAFGYLARRYGLIQIPISGVEPEAEPSPQRVADIAELARRHHVTTIFFERLLSSKVADTVAAEAGIRAAPLDPLESPPQTGGYFSAMRANLEALTRALGCR